MIPVALRSEDPELIETVRSVLAVSAIPLAVFPQSTAEPVIAGLVLDDGAGGEKWQGRSRRYAKVGLRSRGPWPPDVLELPAAAEDLLGLARVANRNTRAKVIGVVGAAGGVGTSVFASAFARVGAENGLMTALVEGRGGPALNELLQVTYTPGLRWADISSTGQDPEHLTSSLPRWENVRLLIGDERPSPDLERIEAPLAALAHAHDLIVLDLQRYDVAGGITSRWCDVVLIVTTCSVPVVRAAQVLCSSLPGQSLGLVVRGPSKSGFPASEVPEVVGAPVLASMRAERSLPAALERGLTPGDQRRGPLLRAAREAMTQLELLST